MNYCKITADQRAFPMPDPYRAMIANPTEEKKALIAQLDGWLPMEYTEQPEYDTETEYLTESWEEENGKAVQRWEVRDRPEGSGNSGDEENE